MEKIIIVALAKNNVIGNGLDIPWHIRDDFLHFKELTKGYAVVMGRNTWISLPRKPLPGRINVVITSNPDFEAEGAVVKSSVEEAISYCEEHNQEKMFYIGGRGIYKEGLERADKLELTRIHKDVDGDIVFPEIDFSKWELIKKEDKTDEKEGEYSFSTYKRK
ncbi:hypothetical protein BVX95_01885 [archaeon D22]|nr:hypothetical protein BVX95_01885 [archaeon D22]